MAIVMVVLCGGCLHIVVVAVHHSVCKSSIVPVAVAHIWDQLQFPVAMFCKYLKTEKDRLKPVFRPVTCWVLLMHNLLNFRSLDHQKQSRIGYDMAKNIFCTFT
jgi:hypothetical protein